MPPGRKPLPTSVKLLRGNAGHRPLNLGEPTPPTGAPPCPAHLSTEATAAWKDIAPALQTLGVLTVADGVALEQLCETYADVVALRTDVGQHGRIQTVVTKTGTPMVRARPEVGMLDAAQRQLRLWLECFGLTPSARSRLKTGAPEQTDIFEELLRQASDENVR